MADQQSTKQTRLDDGPPNAINPEMTLRDLIQRLWEGRATKIDQRNAAIMLMPW
jgi:hypothetical protein